MRLNRYSLFSPSFIQDVIQDVKEDVKVNDKIITDIGYRVFCMKGIGSQYAENENEKFIILNKPKGKM